MYVAMLAITVFIFAVVVWYYVRHPAFSWFHPLTIYVAFHGLVFVIRPVLSWAFGYSLIYVLYQFHPDPYAKLTALVVANLGFVCFAAAALRWGNLPMAFKADRFTAMELRSLRWPLWSLGAALLPFMLYSLYQAWSLRTGDMQDLQIDSATGIMVNVGGNGYVQSIILLAVTLVPIIAWSGRFRLVPLLIAGALVLLLAGGGTRGPIISLMLCLASFYLYASRRKMPDWRVLIIVPLALVMFNQIGADRGRAVRALLGEDVAAQAGPADDLAPMEGMDAANLEFVEYLVDKVPRATGTYEYFLDNLQLFTEPVPRALWKGKPIGQPIRLFYLFDYGFPIGMTRSLPGEGWTQLGLLGVALWCGLWGAILGSIYNAYVRSRQTVIQTAFYVSLLATLVVFYRDGMVITLLRQGVFFVLTPALWALVAWMAGSLRADHFRQLALGAAGPDATLVGRDAGDDRDRPTRAVPRSRRHRPSALRSPR